MPTPTPTDLPTPEAVLPVTLTVIYDNTVYTSGMVADWGFACLIERGETSVLFDTGAKGALLLENFERGGFDVRAIDTVVLSHAHQDHTGGLAALLDAGATPTVVLLQSFPAAFRMQIAERVPVIEVTEAQELLPGMVSTGPLGSRIPEQALAVETPAGWIVITGCAHPGVELLVRRALELAHAERVELLLGGFHLGEMSSAAVEQIIAHLQELGVQRAGPCHCTGARAIQQFAAAYGDNYIRVGAGRQIRLGEP